jgi:hypothetical protein
MTNNPNQRIEELPSQLSPIKDRASKWLSISHAWDADTLKVLLMPWEAPLAAAYWLFAPLSQATNMKMPAEYAALLQSINGFRGLGFDLFGVLSNGGMVNRHAVNPLCIKTANDTWRHDFFGAETWFHFGGCALSEDENGGYFYDGDTIICRTENGGTVDTWAKFEDFLEQELTRTQALCLGWDDKLANLVQSVD